MTQSFNEERFLHENKQISVLYKIYAKMKSNYHANY